MKKELTSRESKVIQWIKHYQQTHGGYPTYREIQGALGFNSINSVSQYIKQLAGKGYLELIKNKGYRLAAVERPAFVSLSLLGSVQAGGPNSTQETSETVALPQQWVTSPQKSFLLKVRGNSMEDAGIHEGDMVVVDSSKKAQVGDIVVALVDGETTVKRLSQKNGKNYLKAESQNHADIHPDDTWEIQGIVKSLIRQY
jgi:repressor LexA